MADKKISELIAAGALTGPEAFAAVQDGATKKVTAEQIKAFSAASFNGVCLGVAADTTLATGEGQYFDLGSPSVNTGNAWWSAADPSKIVIPSGVSKIEMGFQVYITGCSGGHPNIYTNKMAESFFGAPGARPGVNLTTIFTASAISAVPVDVVPGDYFQFGGNIIGSGTGILRVSNICYFWARAV
jgi:hypothetical protein